MIETKFKQTEIGLIPEDWKITKLGELGHFSKGAGISREEAHTGNIAAIRYGEIYTSHNDYIKKFCSGISKKVASTSKKLTFGDLLFAASGETKEEIGKCVAFISHEEAYAGGDIIILSIDTNLQDARYWGYYLNSTQIVKQKAARGQGDAVVHIVPRELATIVIAAPSKQEQQRIAEALSNIDNLISSLSKMIEKKRLIKQGAMQQLLTGKKRLPGFDGGWVEYRIDDVVNRFATGLNPRDNFILNSSGSSNFYVTIKNFKEGHLFLDDNCDKIDDNAIELINHRSDLRSGDVLMSSIGRIGDAYVIRTNPKNWNINESVFSLRPDYGKITSMFLYYTIKSDSLQEQMKGGSTGSTLTSIKMSHLKELTCCIPNSVKEQAAISTILASMDNEIESLEEERDKYIRLKDGMMQKLLTGQIRLIQAEAKKTALPKPKVANVYFKRSVLAAEIADRLCEEKTFGHVKMEKLIFLTEHLCHVDIDSHYHRDAAGPYDNTALRSIDSQMRKQHWFELTKNDKGYRYQPMNKRGEHKKYFDRYFTDILPMFNKIVETFKTSTTEQCEIVATLYSAWNDLVHRGHPFTDDDILNEVLNNWNESKKRINRSRWQAALDWMRNNGFEPHNENN